MNVTMVVGLMAFALMLITVATVGVSFIWTSTIEQCLGLLA